MKTTAALFCILFNLAVLNANIGTRGFHEFAYNRYFVETGSFGGDSIEKALRAGFQFIRSIDLNKGNVEYCKARFSNDSSKVSMFLGDSGALLFEMIQDINEPITFWLDAHVFPPLQGGFENTPLLAELEQIALHPIKTHTILIDDLHCCGTLAFDYIIENEIKDQIREINPDYQFRYVPGGDANEYQRNVRVAFVP